MPRKRKERRSADPQTTALTDSQLSEGLSMDIFLPGNNFKK